MPRYFGSLPVAAILVCQGLGLSPAPRPHVSIANYFASGQCLVCWWLICPCFQVGGLVLSNVLHRTDPSLLEPWGRMTTGSKMLVRGKAAGNSRVGRRRGRGFHQVNNTADNLVSITDSIGRTTSCCRQAATCNGSTWKPGCALDFCPRHMAVATLWHGHHAFMKLVLICKQVQVCYPQLSMLSNAIGICTGCRSCSCG